MKTINELKSAAIVVRDETQISANTANRIGTLFLNIVEVLENTINTLASTKSDVTTAKAQLTNLSSDITALASDVNALVSDFAQIANLNIGIDTVNGILSIGGAQYKLQTTENVLYRGTVAASALNNLKGSDNAGIYRVYNTATMQGMTAYTYFVIVYFDSKGNTYQVAFDGTEPNSLIAINKGAYLRTRCYDAQKSAWESWSIIDPKTIAKNEQELTLQKEIIDTKVIINSEIKPVN